jgi:hypothetical protein
VTFPSGARTVVTCSPGRQRSCLRQVGPEPVDACAHAATHDHPTPPLPTVTTRSGGRAHTPVRFEDPCSSAQITKSFGPKSCPSQIPAYRLSTRAALTAKSGSRMEIQDRCCQGLRDLTPSRHAHGRSWIQESGRSGASCRANLIY